MARKVTAGAAGGESIAGIQAITPTTLTAAPNIDIEIDAEGTGELAVKSHLRIEDQQSLKLLEDSANGTNYVALQAAADISSNVTWTLPDADGSDGQALTTDGAGTLTWVTPEVNFDDESSDSLTNYIPFHNYDPSDPSTIAATDSSSTLRISASSRPLTYQPSTGTLSTTLLTVNGVARSLVTENVQTASYILALTDQNLAVTMNNSTAATVTVPPNGDVAFPIGTVIHVSRVGSGALTLAGGSGVTLSKTGNLAQNEQITLRKRATDSWFVEDSPTYVTGSGGSSSTVGAFTSHSYTSTGSSTFVVGS